MSTGQIAITSTASAERMPSLAALQALHKELLRARRQDGDTDVIVARIEILIRQGQATGAALDTDEDREAAQSILDYWSAILFKTGQTAPDATLAEFDPELAPLLADELCPYVGLDPFREAKRDLFFGRERMITSLLERLQDDRFLVVVGPSGCGKSSIILAGLLPVLRNDALSDSQNWRFAPRMVPGSKPLTNLVRVMSEMLAEEISDPVTWAREQEALLRRDPQHLTKLANSLSSTPIVGIVDQFEEVFTLCNDDSARQAFLDNLANLVRAPGTAHRVILTMRADFEPFVARFPEFQALFEPAVVRVTPLSSAELRDAIEKPAQKVGLKFEAGLVDQLLNDVLGEPAALPLLQFTLLKLWDNRERNRITWQAYNRLGGGRLALARSADDFYDHLIPEDQTTAKRIFSRLVRLGEGLEFTSNRVRLSILFQVGEARDRIQRVIDKLIAARLVRVTEGDIAADVQVEIAHEALVRNWPRLVNWLEEDRHTRRQRQAVADSADRWRASGRDPGGLYTTETLLSEALRIVEVSGVALTEGEQEFLQASKKVQEAAHQEKEANRQRELEQARTLAEAESKRAEAERQRAEAQARSAIRFRRLTVALVITSIATLIALGFAVSSALDARNQREDAVAAQGAAEAGATQVASNLKVAQGSLDAQVGLIDQVATAAAEIASMAVQIQTLEAGSTRATNTPKPAPTSDLESTTTLTPSPTLIAGTHTPGPPPPDTGATATAAALVTQRSAVQTTQTAIARELSDPVAYAIIDWITMSLRAQTALDSDVIRLVRPPSKLPIIDTQDTWILTELPTGERGWIDGRWVVYGGNASLLASLLPPSLRYRVITDRTDLPFVEGTVVSHDGAQQQYHPFKKPADGQEMIVSVPVGQKLLVLGPGSGSTAFGSGQWFIVTFPDPSGENIVYTGYLPVEVVAKR